MRKKGGEEGAPLYSRLPIKKYGRNDEVRKSSFCNHHSKSYSGTNHQQMSNPVEVEGV